MKSLITWAEEENSSIWVNDNEALELMECNLEVLQE